MFGFGKKNKHTATSNKLVQADDKLVDGDLPFGWYSRNEHIYKPYEDKIYELSAMQKELKGDERIEILENLVSFYYEYKSFCYSKNECFTKYFSDMWEHCHNSKCNDFEFIKPVEEELKRLKQFKD